LKVSASKLVLILQQPSFQAFEYIYWQLETILDLKVLTAVEKSCNDVQNKTWGDKQNQQKTFILSDWIRVFSSKY